jgi:hypothetical protein
MVARHLAEKQWHADETHWRAFEMAAGKVTSAWPL